MANIIRFSIVFLYYTQPFSLVFHLLFFWGGGGGGGGVEGVPLMVPLGQPAQLLVIQSQNCTTGTITSSLISTPTGSTAQVTMVAMVILLSDGASAGDM